MDNRPEFYHEYTIFAIDGGERDDIDGLRKRLWFETCLREAGIGFKPLCGCYQGRLERSYIVNAVHMPLLTGWIAGQDTVLQLTDCIDGTAYRMATLRNVGDGKEAYLGLWKPVTETYAHHQPSWTFDPFDGQHYVAESYT